ncbi:MAG: hypothetical protein DDT19_01423 [Syntrophomonadaceae bacterium]|nr:hypothetical protein [Bacillota bacterium]
MQPRGFIALVSVIIISAVLLTVVVGGGLIGFYSRFNILDAEFKERSSALADACVDVLLLRLATGETITNPVNIGSSQCSILTTTSPYQVQAVFNNAYTNLLVAVDGNLTITSWREVASF